MAKIIRGKNHGQEIKLHQWSNDWFSSSEGRIHKATNLIFTKAEQRKIKASDSGSMFDLFEWKDDRLVLKTKGKKLTKKEDKFVENMANPDIESQTEAAIEAGYSEKTAAQIANENLNKPHIQCAIEERKKQAATYAKITPEMILGATVQRAFASIDDAYDEHGNFSFEKARETGAIHHIKKISQADTQFGERISVEFYDKGAAQDKLGNYLGMDKQPAINQTDIQVVAQGVIDRLRADNFSEEVIDHVIQKRYPTYKPEASATAH